MYVISEGPKLFLRIYPVAKTNLHTLTEMILKALVTVDNSTCKTVSCVYDNCKTNGNRYIEAINYDIFLVFDSAHIFKNIRNN